MRTIKLCGGVFEYDVKDGMLIAARKNGEDWPMGYELMKDNKAFVKGLYIISRRKNSHASHASKDSQHK